MNRLAVAAPASEGLRSGSRDEVAATRNAELFAEPNPIRQCEGRSLGSTIIHWSTRTAGSYEIRIGRPNGRLFARVGVNAAAPTGKWVKDGMLFFVVDERGTVVASVEVIVTCNPS
jgi:hypothetical protein